MQRRPRRHPESLSKVTTSFSKILLNIVFFNRRVLKCRGRLLKGNRYKIYYGDHEVILEAEDFQVLENGRIGVKPELMSRISRELESQETEVDANEMPGGGDNLDPMRMSQDWVKDEDGKQEEYSERQQKVEEDIKKEDSDDEPSQFSCGHSRDFHLDEAVKFDQLTGYTTKTPTQQRVEQARHGQEPTCPFSFLEPSPEYNYRESQPRLRIRTVMEKESILDWYDKLEPPEKPDPKAAISLEEAEHDRSRVGVRGRQTEDQRYHRYQVDFSHFTSDPCDPTVESLPCPQAVISPADVVDDSRRRFAFMDIDPDDQRFSKEDSAQVLLPSTSSTGAIPKRRAIDPPVEDSRKKICTDRSVSEEKDGEQIETENMGGGIEAERSDEEEEDGEDSGEDEGSSQSEEEEKNLSIPQTIGRMLGKIAEEEESFQERIAQRKYEQAAKKPKRIEKKKQSALEDEDISEQPEGSFEEDDKETGTKRKQGQEEEVNMQVESLTDEPPAKKKAGGKRKRKPERKITEEDERILARFKDDRVSFNSKCGEKNLIDSFQCPYCGRKIDPPTAGQMRAHLKRLHKEVPEGKKLFKCDYCNFVSPCLVKSSIILLFKVDPFLSNVTRHQETVHENKTKMNCPDCDKEVKR